MAIALPAAGRVLLSWGVAITQAVNDLLAADTLLAADRPTAQLRHGISVNIPPNQWTPLEYNQAHVDSHGGWNSAAPTRYTAQQPGWYLIAGACGWNPTATTGMRGVRWRTNGTTVLDVCEVLLPAAASVMVVPARTMLVALNPGEYIEMQVFQSATVPVATFGGFNTGGSMTIHWVRRR